MSTPAGRQRSTLPRVRRSLSLVFPCRPWAWTCGWLLFSLLALPPVHADEPPSPLAAAAARARAARTSPATTRYTDADLERVRPLRDETGVDSQPAFEPAPDTGHAGRGRAGTARGRGRARSATADTAPSPLHDTRAEAYWRAEARRVEARVRTLRARAQSWQRRIDQRRRRPDVRPYTDPQIVEWQRQRDEVERQARDLEGDLDDRARRARALPGWLR